MKNQYWRLVFIALLFFLVVGGGRLTICHAEDFNVYCETAPGCTLFPNPYANSRIGTYQDPWGSWIELYSDTLEEQEGYECLRAEIYVVPGGWVGWFVQWGIYWEEYPNEDTTRDMSAYTTGYLRFRVKTPIELKVGIRSSNIMPGNERSKVKLSDYCEIDTTWHHVSIPIPDFLERESRFDLTRVKILFNIAREGGTSDTLSFWVDDVRWTQFYLENIAFDKALNQGSIIDTLYGEGFEEGAEVKLVRDTLSILGTNTAMMSSKKIVTTFDLTDAQIGMWDIEVTNPDGHSTALNDAFEVRLMKPQSTGPIRIDGRELLVDGHPYTIKGVGYSPTPIGKSPEDTTEEINWTLPDYGDPDIGIYDRDFDLLQKMHCNTIRTWGKATGALLDKADEYELKVICGFWVDYYLDFGDSTIRDSLINGFGDYVQDYYSKPSVLMWSIGNEQNYQNGNNPEWYTLVNEMAKAAYDIEDSSYHPVTTPNGELYNMGQTNIEADDISMNYLDAWGANVYRGLSFGILFSEYAPLSSKPFWVSEYGIDAWDHENNRENQEIQAVYDATLWDEILADTIICSGGTIMAYSDEWWKNGDPMSHDSGGYPMPPFPDAWSDEEYWGMMRVEDNGDSLDIMHPRVVYYTLQSKWGTADSPEVSSVYPDSGSNDGQTQVAIIGDHFQAQADVKLVKDEQTLFGLGTVVQTPDTITTTFDLTDVSPGTWSVVVSNIDAQADTCHDCFTIYEPTFVHDSSTPIVPTKTELGYPFPSPFNPQTTIPFTLRTKQTVQLAVYNVRGALVKRLVDRIFPTGRHSVIWNGTDENGHKVSSGIYLVRFTTRAVVSSRKIVLLR